MQENFFFKLGKVVYKLRVLITIVWLGLIIACFPFLPTIITPFKSTGFTAEHSESVRTDAYLDKHLGYNYNRFLIIYHSDSLEATNPQYIKKMKDSLAGLKNFPIQHEIIYPHTNKKQISSDKHTAYVVIFFKDNKPMGHKLLTQLQQALKKPVDMTMKLGGEAIFVEGINQQTQTDLYKADMIAAPISIVTLILVFGTIIAALVPIVLGGGCALIILTSLYFLGQLFDLSIFTLNIALLLGLCLSLDYSLFIISRFRDELRTESNICNAIARTLATAGKAVFFSGLAVFISLSALLLFPINILFSVGIGGMAAVFTAVAIAITLLPALLALLKNGINRLAIPYIFHENAPEKPVKMWHFWQKLAEIVVGRPLFFFFSTLVLLLFLGYPFLNAQFGISDYHIFPKHSQSRQFFDTYEAKFHRNGLTPIFIVVSTDKGDILSKKNIGRLYDFTQALKKNPAINEVNSIVTTDSKLSKSEYQMLYASDAKTKNKDLKQLLETTTRKQMTVVSIISNYPSDSLKNKQLITELHQMKLAKNLSIQLTGTPVNNLDVLEAISATFPYAVLWIMVLTYLILLLLLRSLFLPLKAILMNMLSLCASYGVLVFIFQEGHFHHALNFIPQGMLDISMIIIIFCALFGFSMDYEVFLLTRIHECYLQTQDNEKSIIFGIVKSSRIITSAAIIVIFICGSFMVADNLMIKEFGLGIASAIFVDAFIIRTILVPATMVLVKQVNWYLPKWLDKILPNHSKPER